MEKNFSVKILLKNICDSREIFEESIVVIKANSVDEIAEKVNLYVHMLNGNSDENKVLELVSILDYFEVEDKVKMEDTFVDVYSRYLDDEELELYRI